MRVKVVYIWDSADNSYSPDGNDFDVMAEPTPEDRMRWKFTEKGRHPKTGVMNLTRGFEMLMYLAGFANDVASRVLR